MLNDHICLLDCALDCTYIVHFHFRKSLPIKNSVWKLAGGNILFINTPADKESEFVRV